MVNPMVNVDFPVTIFHQTDSSHTVSPPPPILIDDATAGSLYALCESEWEMATWTNLLTTRPLTLVRDL